MGKPTGFMEFQRVSEGYAPVEQRVKTYHEFVAHLTDAEAKQQGARCMDCGIPFCNNGCPVNNIIPDWNDLVYRGNWKEALEVLALHQQLPRSDRTHLSRTVRSGVHAEHQQRRGRHQVHRACHHRQGRRERLGRAATGKEKDRQESCRGRFRPCGIGCCTATGSRRTQRHRVRKEQPHRRPAALWHSRTSSWTSA